jgi:hypothetical protein
VIDFDYNGKHGFVPHKRFGVFCIKFTAEFNNSIRIFLPYLHLCKKYSLLALLIYNVDLYFPDRNLNCVQASHLKHISLISNADRKTKHADTCTSKFQHAPSLQLRGTVLSVVCKVWCTSGSNATSLKCATSHHGLVAFFIMLTVAQPSLTVHPHCYSMLHPQYYYTSTITLSLDRRQASITVPSFHL